MLRVKKLCAFASFAAAATAALLYAGESESTNKQESSAESSITSSQEDLSHAEILKVSEAFGHFIGRNLNAPGIKFDLDSIIKGMREGAEGKPAPMSEKEYEQAMALIQEKAFAKLSQDNMKAADDFLAKNAQEPNVVILKPGRLQYLIIAEGSGQAVTPQSTPLINYSGRYIDGTSFGSSEDVGGPISVPLDQTIPGFSEGIAGMKEGERRRLFVHPEMGYGASGHLAPNSLLIFDIEVVKANQPEQVQSDEEDEDFSPSTPHQDSEDRDKTASSPSSASSSKRK